MQLRLFLPCAAGVESYLAQQVQAITGLAPQHVEKWRGGVLVHAAWRDALLLNLHCRLAQRVLVQLAHSPYRGEQDLYRAAMGVAWEAWFTPACSIKVEITAQHSPLKSLNFAALTIKDAVCDRFREKARGVRPNVDTRRPDVRIYAHLTTSDCFLYLDTSGEPLFKRGWREDTGDAPLKETLAAAMLIASGWPGDAAHSAHPATVLYDPCCGSGTIAIEAAQMACNIPAGSLRAFAFEKLLPYQAHVWAAIKKQAAQAVRKPPPGAGPWVYGSDVSHRMVDFAQRNAQRAGVADVIDFRGGDALQRMPPVQMPGVMVLNPPYGERIEVGGVAGQARFGARELAHTPDGGDFFSQLASHWKKNYAGWTAWVLTPDLQMPSKMRLKESRRVPMWNGPLECRLFRFDMVAGKMDKPHAAPAQDAKNHNATDGHAA